MTLGLHHVLTPILQQQIFLNQRNTFPQKSRFAIVAGWLVSMKSGGELSAHIPDAGWITGNSKSIDVVSDVNK